MKKTPNKKWLKAALKSLLVTINGFEGLEMESLAESARDILKDLKNELEKYNGFQSNGSLAELDAVFKAAGWDDQGLRWTTEKQSDHGVQEIWIVHFKDKHHSTWEIA